MGAVNALLYDFAGPYRQPIEVQQPPSQNRETHHDH